MGEEVGGSLEVGFLEEDGGGMVVGVGEVEAAEVVEKRDSLCGRVVGQGRGVCCYVCEDLFCQMGLFAL